MAGAQRPGAVLAALILTCAVPALATLQTSHLASDQDMLDLLSDTLFVGEGRVGDGWGAATFELDLGGDSGSPAVTEQYEWPNGVSVAWSITYDDVTDLATLIVDGIDLQYVTPLSGFTDIFVRTRAVNADSEILVENLVLDGEIVGDQSYAVGSGGLDILWISGGILTDGFTLTGTTTMTWSGSPPT